MLSTQPQADLPVRFSRLGTTALASHAACFEDSSAPLETRKARYDCDFALRLRNATYRSNYSARDADEVRVLVSYSVAVW